MSNPSATPLQPGTNPSSKKQISGPVSFFLLLMVATTVVTAFMASTQSLKLKAQAVELDALKGNEAALSKSMEEAEAEAKKLRDENAAMKENLAKFETDKEAILNQVRTSVSTFESFRAQANSEIEGLKKTMTQLQNEKQEAAKKLAEAENLSKAEQEKLIQDLAAMTQKIEEHKVTEAKLAEKIKGREKAAIIDDTTKLHYNLGNFYVRQGNFKNAVREYEKALFYNSKDADTHWNLAVISDENLHDRPKAIEHYRAYLQLRPDGPDAQKVQRRILDLESAEKIMVDNYIKTAPADVRESGIFDKGQEQFNSMRLMKDK